MRELGRLIFIAGFAIAAIGWLMWRFGEKNPLGRLPGDISVERENFSFYFPITTCILLSLVLTLLLWLFRR